MLYTVYINKNEKLVFYESNKNALCCGLVKRKWNNKWIVIQQGGQVPLFLQKNNKENDNKEITWVWTNMKEFGISFGTINSPKVNKIKVGDKSAVIINADNKSIWYFIDKTGSSYLHYKPDLDIKAFDEAGNLVYSYYKQK